MDQKLHFITLATPDLEASLRFYRDGLGWTPLLVAPGEIVFFQIAPGLALGFFEAHQFEEDLQRAPSGTTPSVDGLVLAHNVPDRESVVATLDAFEAAGGSILKPAQDGAFGGVFHGHATDPNGVVWEIAHNPWWGIEPDGSVRLSTPDDQ